MNILRSFIGALLALSIVDAAVADDASIEAGRQVFQRNCQTCHGVTGPAAWGAGPDLHGIVGSQAGTEDSGIHSRAALESGLVWSRETLRRYIQDPDRSMPGTIMTGPPLEPAEIEQLLDFLEHLR